MLQNIELISPIGTVQSDILVGIVGCNEYLDYYNKNFIQDKENIALICIHEPGNFIHPESKVQGFHDVLQMQFWDIEKDFANYKTISYEQGKEIRDFIIKNKDKKFLIHCAAGVSRSAGVGCAVECLVNYNGISYDYKIGHSDIKNHKRYSPNWTVYDRIINEK